MNFQCGLPPLQLGFREEVPAEHVRKVRQRQNSASSLPLRNCFVIGERATGYERLHVEYQQLLAVIIKINYI